MNHDFTSNRTLIALIVWSLLLLQIAAGYGQQQRSASVSGIVKEQKSAQPLEYANIALYSLPDSALVTGTISDFTGKFSIAIPKPGNYYAVIDFIGYARQTTNAFKAGGKHGSHSLGTIPLSPSNVSLDEVSIISDKPAVQYKMDRKVVDVSRNAAMQGGSAADALSGIPSISTDIEGEVILRGSSAFSVLIDGRLSPLSSSDALKQIPASAISSIEIITNPSVKYDPDGTAGIINIITKKGKLKGHSVIANASIGTSPKYGGDASYIYRSKRYMLSASAGYSTSKSTFEKNTNRTPDSTGVPSITTAEDGVRNRTSGFIKLGTDYYATPNNTVSIGAGLTTFRYNRYYLSDIYQYDSLTKQSYSVTDQSFDVRPQSLQFTLSDKQLFNSNEQHYLYVSGEYQIKQKTNDEYVINESVFDYRPSAILDTTHDRSNTDEDASSVRLEAQYSHPLSENITAETGYSLRSDQYGQTFSKTSISKPVYNDKATFTRNIHAGWLLLNTTIGSYSFGGGVRIESTDRSSKTNNNNYQYTYTGWYPSAAVTKTLDKEQTVQLSYSKRINRPRDYHLTPFPRLSDGYSQFQPNPNLKPEQAHSFELNYQKSWGKNYAAAETFYRFTSDEMERIETAVNDTLTRTIVNAGSESDAGIELNVNVNIFQWWNINPLVSVAYHTESTDFGTIHETTQAVEYEASMTNVWRYKANLKFQLSGNYSGPRKIVGGTADAMYYLSAAIKYDFPNRQFSASLAMQDIFESRSRVNNTYSDNSHIYTFRQRQGRIVTLSVSYKLNAANTKRDRKQRSNESMDGDY